MHAANSMKLDMYEEPLPSKGTPHVCRPCAILTSPTVTTRHIYFLRKFV